MTDGQNIEPGFEEEVAQSKNDSFEQSSDLGVEHSEIDSVELVETSIQAEDSVVIQAEDSVVAEETVEEELDSSIYKWYCLRTYTGHEAKVKLMIEVELKRLGLKHKVAEIIIPQETVFEVRGGKRRTKIKNFLPGYIVIRVDLDKKVKDIIQNLPSVVSFVGTKTEPASLRKSEIDRIIGRVEERKSISTIETTFEIGDPVKVIDGPFSSFNGTVKEVNFEKQKLKVEVGILGRKTPVELDFSQVEMENH
jgi:transcriptional antiterminator NusG